MKWMAIDGGVGLRRGVCLRHSRRKRRDASGVRWSAGRRAFYGTPTACWAQAAGCAIGHHEANRGYRHAYRYDDRYR